MQTLIAYKEALINAISLDRDLLRVLLSPVGLLLISAMCRKTLADPLPWLMLLSLLVPLEIAGGLADGQLEVWEFWASAYQVSLFMTLPTLLFAATRWTPSLFTAGPRPVALQPLPTWPKKLVYDADYEDADFEVVVDGEEEQRTAQGTANDRLRSQADITQA